MKLEQLGMTNYKQKYLIASLKESLDRTVQLPHCQIIVEQYSN